MFFLCISISLIVFHYFSARTIPISSILNGRNSNVSSSPAASSSHQHQQHITNQIEQFQFNQQPSANTTTTFVTNDDSVSMIRPSNDNTTTTSTTVVESTSTSIVKIIDHIDQHRIVGLHHPISCKNAII